MYGARWVDNGNGTFTAAEAQTRFGFYDLYLLGLAAPEEVPPTFLIEPTLGTPFSRSDLPVVGAVVEGTRVEVTVDQLIAAMGPRVPSFEDSPKEFRIGFAYVHASQTPDPADLQIVDRIRRDFEQEFFFLTRGRAIVDTSEAQVESIGQASPEALESALAFLIAARTPQGLWSDDARSTVVDSSSVLRVLRQTESLAPAPLESSLDALALAASTASSSAARAEANATLRELGRTPDSSQSELTPIGIAPGYRPEALSTVSLVRELGRDNPAGGVAAFSQLQNFDGGFSLIEGGVSDVATTALALEAVLAIEPGAVNSVAGIEATLFLERARRADGSYGIETGGLLETALSARTLLGTGRLERGALDETLLWVLERQEEGGSWAGSVRLTAEIAALLYRANTPNLTVNSSTLEVNTLREGEDAVVAVDVGAFALALPDSPVALSVEDASVGEVASVSVGFPPERQSVRVVVPTDGLSGERQWTIRVDPDDSVSETNEFDNSFLLPVQISPRPLAADLEVVNLVLSPEPVVTLPQALALSATIRNRGRTVAGPSVARLSRNGVLVSEQPIDVPPASDVELSFSDVLEVPLATYTLVLDPANVISEADEQNNSFSRTVSAQSTRDVAVLSVSGPSQAAAGEQLTFLAEVQNRGTLAQAFFVEVRLEGDNGLRPLVGERTLTLMPGERRTESFDWTASFSGDAVVVAQVDPDNLIVELDEQNNLTTFAITLTPVSQPNLLVSNFESTGVLDEGADAPFEVTVTNTGDASSEATVVQLVRGAVSGLTLNTEPVPALASGESAVVALVWSAIDRSGAQTLTARVDPADAVRELDEGDNASVLEVAVRSKPDLELAADGLSLSPSLPGVGDEVTLTVSVSNVGDQEAAIFDVSVNSVAGSETLGFASVPGNTQASGVITLTVPEVTEFEISAVADSGDVVEEGSELNNATSLLVRVQDGALIARPPLFSPNGDGRVDEAVISYALEGADVVSAGIRSERGETVYTFADAFGEAGDLIWSGQDNAGRRVADGTYTLEVRGAGRVETLELTVDTDRTALLDVIRDGPLESLSAFNYFTELPDDNPFTSGSERRTGLAKVARLYVVSVGLDFGRFGTFEILTNQRKLASVPEVTNLDISDFRAGGFGPEGTWLQSGPQFTGDPEFGALLRIQPGESEFQEVALIPRDDFGNRSTTPYSDASGRFVATCCGVFDTSTTPVTQPIFVADTETGILKSVDRLGSDGAGGAGRLPVVSPDGRYLYFIDQCATSFGPTTCVLNEVDLNTNERRSVEVAGSNDQTPVIPFAIRERIAAIIPGSPLIQTVCRPRVDLYDFSTDTLRSTPQFGPTPCRSKEPVWSPTGDAVVAVMDSGVRFGDPGPTDRLFLVDVETLDVTEITDRFPSQSIATGRVRSIPLVAQTQDGTAWTLGRGETLATKENLFASLRILRDPGLDSVSLTAEVDDRHFDRFRIDAIDQTGERLVVVAPRTGAVDSEIVASWAPPTTGLYTLELVAEDRAGNVLVTEETLSFDAVPAVRSLVRR
ncbi:MAG: CARDB domain-containing protein [Myxococcota bacterium]